MSQNTYLNILKIGCWSAFIVIFFVFRNLLFPYITSKQISFNILIEVLFIFWIAFIIKYPEYRPRKNYVWIALAAFFFTLFLSAIFGVDWNLSFWGDIERMLGVFHILHFLAYYFIIITVMRSWRDWKIFLILSTIFAVIVSIQVDTSSEGYGTIGNTAYVSGYLLFNMYIAWLLFFKESQPVVKWLYPAAFLLMWPGFLQANTTGAWVGLGASLVVVTFLYGILQKNKKIKIATLAAFVLVSTFIGYVFILDRDNYLTRNSDFMYRLVSEVNFNKRTFQTRLVSWRAALRAFPEHPILGTGHGNYAVIFDKYFDPEFYVYARGETYFDRAHNNVVDIASTAGSLGILAYLSIFGAVAWYFIRGYRQGKMSIHEFTLISGLLSAYFVQNLAVFDSLVTYIMLMISLGYIYWIEYRDEDWERPADEGLVNKEIYALFLVGVFSLTVLYQYNVKPLQMLDATIDGQRSWAMGNVKQTIADYERALSYNTPLDRDSRTSLVRVIVSGANKLRKLDKEEAGRVLDYAISLARENVEYNEQDSLNQMLLAQVLSVAADFYKDDQEKFSYYSNQALEAIDKSVAASPGRTPVYFQKAQIHISRGDKEGAIRTLKEAASLHEEYEPAYCHLAKTLLYYQEEEEGYEYMDRCIDKGGAKQLRPANVLKGTINHYAEAEDWERTVLLYEALVSKQFEPKKTENWIKLAKLYQMLQMPDKAREAAEQAIELDPGIEQYAEEFMNEL